MENKSVQKEELSAVPNESMQNDPMEEQVVKGVNKKAIVAVYGVLIVFGVATGYLLSRTGGVGNVITGNQKPGFVNTGKVAGITDTRTFKDSAVGTIEKGSLNGEGTHKLIRDGGPSQTVTLLSSAVDLDQYVGKQVKVWGQTMAAKKAAWLMDVGKIELQ